MKLLRLLAVMIVLNLSCQTKPKQESATSKPANATLDSATALGKRPGRDAPRSAADRLVRALYFEHNKQENPFRDKNDQTLAGQFFAKPIADRIRASNKPSKINPLFKAPDQDVRKTWVEPAAVGGSRAVVYVTFLNKTKPEEIKVDLTQTDGRWRIIELHYPDGTRLTQNL